MNKQKEEKPRRKNDLEKCNNKPICVKKGKRRGKKCNSTKKQNNQKKKKGKEKDYFNRKHKNNKNSKQDA